MKPCDQRTNTVYIEVNIFWSGVVFSHVTTSRRSESIPLSHISAPPRHYLDTHFGHAAYSSLNLWSFFLSQLHALTISCGFDYRLEKFLILDFHYQNESHITILLQIMVYGEAIVSLRDKRLVSLASLHFTRAC